MSGRCEGEPGLTRAVVDLTRIRHNVAGFKELVQDAQVLSVVKANAYGHGAFPVARAALSAGASRLGVYTVSEGLALRAAGVTAPILVFGPFRPADAAQIANFQLTATVHNIESARALQETGASVTAHVKVDTGLSRAGVEPKKVAGLLETARSFHHLTIEGLYTHFARAEEPDPGPTVRQLDTFLRVADELTARGLRPPMLHAANTAATLAFPAAWLDMVRIGIGMYGYYPSPVEPPPVPLAPALSLESTLTRLHTIHPGDGVGYGHEFVAARDTVVGLVPVGYGDGLPRGLGCGHGSVLIRRARVPIIGRVSMDQITIDVTDVAGATVGDAVTLIGSQGDVVQTADDLASRAGTISYEILTRLMPRVPRLYIGDAA